MFLYGLIMMTTEEKLHEWLDNATDSEIIQAWNTYCGENNLGDDQIMSLNEWEFNDLFASTKPWDLLRMVEGEVNSDDNYYSFRNDEMYSYNNWKDDSCYDEDNLIEWLVDNYEMCDIDLSEYDEEDEDYD